jgi:hypothetical protein
VWSERGTPRSEGRVAIKAVRSSSKVFLIRLSPVFKYAGVPASPPSRRWLSKGICAKRGTSAPTRAPRRLAVSAPPPLPKRAMGSAQWGQGLADIFSTTPITLCFIWWAIRPARSATSAAAICGVVTTKISERGINCPKEIAISPVPGVIDRGNPNRHRS